LVGLHIRLDATLLSVTQKAQRLSLQTFQCFLTGKRGKRITISAKERKKFLQSCGSFSHRYLHGSYWINLCNQKSSQLELIHKEFTLAQELGFTHIVLHPGSAKRLGCKKKGIDEIARKLNILLAHYVNLNIILENTAHGRLNIGSDLQDFKILLEKIDCPDALSFCLDTAHAYSYGYDIVSPTKFQDFLSLVDDTIGLHRVGLIHLNDTQEELGKKIDRHHPVGSGNIGEAVLRRFICAQGLQNVPVILELPVMDEKEEITIIRKVQGWKNDEDSHQWAG
jgi:deoxyribonuclease IV